MQRVCTKVNVRWTCVTQKKCSKFTVFNFETMKQPYDLHLHNCSGCSWMELKYLYPTLGPIYCHSFFGTYTGSVSRIFVLQIWSTMLEKTAHWFLKYFLKCSTKHTVPSCITLSKWSISSVSLVRPQRYNVPSLQWANTQKRETQSSNIHTVLRKQNQKADCFHLLSLPNRNMLTSSPTNSLSTGKPISINGYFICFSISMAYLEATQHSLLLPVGEEANRALWLA